MIVGFLILFLYLPVVFLVTVYLIFIVMLDEVLTNFDKIARRSAPYFYSMIAMVFSTVCFFILEAFSPHLADLVAYIPFCIHLLLLYEFKTSDGESLLFSKKVQSIYFSSLFFILYLMLKSPNSQFHVLIVVGCCAVADSFAWIGGKLFGKRRLSMSISPNKTIEGALVGMLTGFFYILIINYYFFGKLTAISFACAMMLPVLSIIGDLVQSRFKRIAKIKDSSNLIPGHGGFYDRLDSHLYVLPYYFIFFLKR
jgi:phosphatidate cytidylyltransferase